MIVGVFTETSRWGVLWIGYWSGVAPNGGATFWTLAVLLWCAHLVDCGGTTGQNKVNLLTGEFCV